MGKYPTQKELDEVFAGSYNALAPLAEQGAQALVFRADTPSAKTVVLKLYDPDDTIEERTEREVEALRKLSCVTIAELHDAGEIVIANKAYRFLATTFIEGETLGTAIRRGPLPVHDVAQIGIDIADAIAKLWQLKIVHRDIKPANIIWTPTRRY
jgi:serine/threonine protein kinase